MQPELLEQVLQQTGKYIHTVQLYFQGEPTLNHFLPDLVRVCSKYRVVSILSTNAQCIDAMYAEKIVEAGLNRIIISLDGITQESYEQYRVGGKIQRVFDAVKYLRNAKDKFGADIDIVLQCLRLSTNEHEWNELKNKYKLLGADKLEFKTAQVDISDGSDDYSLLPLDSRYSRYIKGNDGAIRRKKQLHNRCFRLWSGCVINVSGEVLPCCFDKSSHFVFGQLSADFTFSNCWFSPMALAFRRRILTDRQSISICNNCTE